MWASDWPPLDLRGRLCDLEAAFRTPILAGLQPRRSARRPRRHRDAAIYDLDPIRTRRHEWQRRPRIGFIGVGLMGHGAAKQHPRARRISADHPRPSQSRAGRRSRPAAAHARRRRRRRSRRRATSSSSACPLRSRSRRLSTARTACSPALRPGIGPDRRDHRRPERARGRSAPSSRRAASR